MLFFKRIFRVFNIHYLQPTNLKSWPLSPVNFSCSWSGIGTLFFSSSQPSFSKGPGWKPQFSSDWSLAIGTNFPVFLAGVSTFGFATTPSDGISSSVRPARESENFLGGFFVSPSSFASWLEALGPLSLSSVSGRQRCVRKITSSTTILSRHWRVDFKAASYCSCSLVSPAAWTERTGFFSKNGGGTERRFKSLSR